MMPDTVTNVAGLLEEIQDAGLIMPVRAMERVLAAGTSAVPALLDALDLDLRDAGDNGPSPASLWLVVLLGELRDPRVLEPLVACVAEPESDYVALAAAEALAKLGEPAVPALLDLARADGLTRILGLAGLGWVPDPRSHAALVDALDTDHEHTDIVAMALRDHGRADDIPRLYLAYERCEAWQRPDLADAIRALHAGTAEAARPARDWRMRYRPPYRWALASWPLMARQRRSRHPRRHGPGRTRREGAGPWATSPRKAPAQAAARRGRRLALADRRPDGRARLQVDDRFLAHR